VANLLISDNGSQPRIPPGSNAAAGFKGNYFGRFFFQRPQLGYTLMAGVAAVFLALFFGYPLLNILKFAIYDDGFTTVHFREIFFHPQGHYLSVFLTTFRVAAIVTVLSFVLGYPMAGLLLCARQKWQRLFMICIILPFWTSVLVRTYAWMVLLGRRGLVNTVLIQTGLVEQPVNLLFNTTGTIIGMTHIMLPYMIFPLFSVMQNIDLRLMSAAYTLGAKPRQAFLKIFLPLSLPGIFGGGLLVFIISLGFFITPALMGGHKDLMMAVLIERRVMDLLQWGMGAALGLVLLGATLLLVIIVRRFIGIETLFGGGR
jgi:putative spermidine/putrescine transport system permease protein